MYNDGFRIKENIGNNSFAYDIRKLKNSEPQIYVTNLIQGTIDDIQIGDKIVFEEIDSKGQTQSFTGLKNFVHLLAPLINWVRGDSIPIYIIDNHNHALFFRYQELFNLSISRGIELIHIDQHTDMNINTNVIARNAETKQSYNIEELFDFVNYKSNVGNFITPAIQDRLVSKVIQINTEYSLIQYSTSRNESGFILDIDLDFWHPQMGIEQYAKTIEITKNLISQASLVTIATSPYFLDQTLAIKIIKDIFST